MENEHLLLQPASSVALNGQGLGIARSDTQVSVALQVFRREGEYWTIAYDGAVCRLRDTKGMQLLAFLLRRPGQPVPATQLLGAPSVAVPHKVVTATASAEVQDAVSSGWAAAERARVNVTRAIKGALQKIGAHHPTLSAHLSHTIRTGYACVYLPDPRKPMWWATVAAITAFAVNGWDEV